MAPSRFNTSTDLESIPLKSELPMANFPMMDNTTNTVTVPNSKNANHAPKKDERRLRKNFFITKL
jgi:hypothetical protein